MHQNDEAVAPVGRLRALVLQKYSSTSEGPHRRVKPQQFASYISAYKYYLHGVVPQPPLGPWVDLGCGQGSLLCLAIQQGYTEVLGLDASEEMVASARAAGVPVELADVTHWLATESPHKWGVVSAFDFLEHFSRERGFELLAHMRRILLPEGVCILQMPNANSPWCYGVMAGDLTHEAAYCPASIAQMAKLAGFAHCEVREMGPPPGTPARLVRRLLWMGIRCLYKFLNLVETGTDNGDVYSRVMLVRLWGEAENRR
jgi:SAM-dependent methyltransferase